MRPPPGVSGLPLDSCQIMPARTLAGMPLACDARAISSLYVLAICCGLMSGAVCQLPAAGAADCAGAAAGAPEGAAAAGAAGAVGAAPGAWGGAEPGACGDAAGPGAAGPGAAGGEEACGPAAGGAPS